MAGPEAALGGGWPQAGGAALLAWAAAAAAVWGVAARRADALRRAPPSRAPPPVRYTLVRPCAGAEAHLAANLRSAAHLVGPLPAQVILVLAPDDAAAPVAAAAAAELRAAGLPTQVRAVDAVGANHKAAQLAALGPPTAPTVYADSDVDLRGFPIDSLLTPLAAGAAAAWAPCVEAAAPGTAGRAGRAVLDSGLHAFALLGHLDRHGCVGKLLAVDAAALAAVGGWGAFTEVLGEDVALAGALRRRGLRTAMGAAAGVARPGPRPWGRSVARLGRWLQVVRGQRRGLWPSYPLLFFPLPLMLAAAAALATPMAAAAAALVLAARLRLAGQARRHSGLPPLPRWRQAGDVLASDLLLLQAWCAASTRRSFRWRARRLRVDRRGRLHVLGPAAGGAQPRRGALFGGRRKGA